MKAGASQDQALSDALRQDDLKAFHEIYEKYSGKLYYYALNFRVSREDAEEIVQETFIRVWENRRSIDPCLSLNAYIITIARNLIFNHIRKSLHRVRYINETVKDCRPEPAVSSAEEKDLQRLTEEAVRLLPERCREVFCLSRFDGYSNQQISEKLMISKSTVENQMNKALKSIRRYLEHYGYGA